jgi:mRNA-degrading endonuclease RelE of RelBE toxin-antitoxin system
MFDLKFTEQAVDDLQVFSRPDQKWILEACESQLTIDAATESADRKQLDDDGLWEIRLAKIRIFYKVDIENKTVKIKAVGRKMLL